MEFEFAIQEITKKKLECRKQSEQSWSRVFMLCKFFCLSFGGKHERERDGKEKSGINYIIYVIQCEFFRSHEAEPLNACVVV